MPPTLRLLVFGFLAAASAQAQDLLLQKAHVIDPLTGSTAVSDILLQNGVIRKITPAFTGPFSGKKIDLSGRWIVSGFTDMHTHSTFGNPGPAVVQRLTPADVARLMLYSGVTSFVDLFADEDEIFRARADQRSRSVSGADILAAGPMLTCTGGHGTEFGIRTRTIDSPAQATKQIDALMKRKPDVIKIAYDHAKGYPSMNEATMRAAIAAAHRFKRKTIVHIGTWQDAKEAVLAGTDAVTHLYDTEIPDDLVKLMHDRGVYEIPTMTYQTELVHAVDNPAWLDSPLLAEVTAPDLLASYKHLDLSNEFVLRQLGWQRKAHAAFQRSVKKMGDGGVKLMTGTDGGDLAVFQGFSVHREMQILVDSGLSTWLALAAATSLPDQFLGRSVGIRENGRAELVVLKGSPIADIRNTQQIEMVIHRGKIVDRSALLPSARARAETPLPD